MRLLSLALAAALFVGCGGGSGGSPSSPNVTGNWHMTATSSSSGTVVPLNGNIVDTQNATHDVQASLDDGTGDCPGIRGNLGPVLNSFLSGHQSGQSIPLSGQGLAGANLVSIAMPLTATLDGNSLNGTYSVTGGCSDNGTVSGVRVPPLTGSWRGIVDGGPVTFSASLSQPSTSISTITGGAQLSGTVQFTSSSCFFSGMLFGSYVTGDLVSFNINMADGMAIFGTGHVTDPPTAKAMLFSYEILPPNGGTGPCNGQTGTFTMNR